MVGCELREGDLAESVEVVEVMGTEPLAGIEVMLGFEAFLELAGCAAADEFVFGFEALRFDPTKFLKRWFIEDMERKGETCR